MLEITVENKKDKSSPHGSSVLTKDGDKKSQCYEEKNSVKGIEKERSCYFRMSSDGIS